jgi:hypothetical protein
MKKPKRDGLEAKTHAAFLTSTMIVFALALAVFWISSGFKDTAYNGYVIMAAQWLDGHIWIDHPPLSVDTIAWHGHYQIIEAPMPGLIMLPWVAIFGMNASQELVAVFCSAITIAAAWVVLTRMGMTPAPRIALTAFIGLGTAVWWNTAFAALWMFAGVVAAMFAMLALAEFYGARRAWLVGLLIGCAALARMPLILAALPLGLWFAFEKHDNHSESLRRLGQFAAGVAPGLLAYFLYNYARYHTFADIGYTVWFHQDQVGQPVGSPFQLQFVPTNLYSYFMLAPELAKSFPWFRPTGYGVSLTLTSPACSRPGGAVARSRDVVMVGGALARRGSDAALLRKRNRAVRHASQHRLHRLCSAPHGPRHDARAERSVGSVGRVFDVGERLRHLVFVGVPSVHGRSAVTEKPVL